MMDLRKRDSFYYKGYKIILAPLSPRDIYQDQQKLQEASNGVSGSEVKQNNEIKESKKERHTGNTREERVSSNEKERVESDTTKESERKERERKGKHKNTFLYYLVKERD